ncbi:MAG: putative toxin-antitoxin system toxin component, PIN family [Treponema sp.]|jgi:putative PIN family toxin of toxin-antitoxin system|nr:putative toxin-antitoxin system toxin component, PIN family [Treponema sp.]
MMRVVLDTNVLVSALWTPAGNASTIINLILTDKIVPCFDQHILNEYRIVLLRPRLAFPAGQVNELLSEITDRGFSVTIMPSSIVLPDESDRKFFDTAKYCEAYLITGNIKHYPKDPLVLTPARFLGILRRP